MAPGGKRPSDCHRLGLEEGPLKCPYVSWGPEVYGTAGLFYTTAYWLSLQSDLSDHLRFLIIAATSNTCLS